MPFERPNRKRQAAAVAEDPGEPVKKFARPNRPARQESVQEVEAPDENVRYSYQDEPASFASRLDVMRRMYGDLSPEGYNLRDWGGIDPEVADWSDPKFDEVVAGWRKKIESSMATPLEPHGLVEGAMSVGSAVGGPPPTRRSRVPEGVTAGDVEAFMAATEPKPATVGELNTILAGEFVEGLYAIPRSLGMMMAQGDPEAEAVVAGMANPARDTLGPERFAAAHELMSKNATGRGILGGVHLAGAVTPIGGVAKSLKALGVTSKATAGADALAVFGGLSAGPGEDRLAAAGHMALFGKFANLFGKMAAPLKRYIKKLPPEHQEGAMAFFESGEGGFTFAAAGEAMAKLEGEDLLEYERVLSNAIFGVGIASLHGPKGAERGPVRRPAGQRPKFKATRPSSVKAPVEAPKPEPVPASAREGAAEADRIPGDARDFRTRRREDGTPSDELVRLQKAESDAALDAQRALADAPNGTRVLDPQGDYWLKVNGTWRDFSADGTPLNPAKTYQYPSPGLPLRGARVEHPGPKAREGAPVRAEGAKEVTGKPLPPVAEAQTALRRAVRKGAPVEEQQRLRDELVKAQDGGVLASPSASDPAGQGRIPPAKRGAPPDPIIGAPKKTNQAQPLKDFPQAPEPTPDFKGKPVGTQEVMKALSSVVDVPLRIGRVRGRKAAGEFHMTQEVARVRDAGDIPTMTHEIGHAISTVAFERAAKSTGWFRALGRGIRADMMKLGKALYPGKIPNGGHAREGFAEAIRKYVTDPAALDATPALRDWLTKEFLPSNPEMHKRLDSARDLARQFQVQGADNFVAANMVVGRAGPSVARKVAHYFSSENFVEGGSELKALADRAIKAGHDLRPGQNPYDIFSFERLSGPSLVKHWVEKGTTDIARNPTGGSYDEAFDIVRGMGKGAMKKFRAYGWARHAMDLHHAGINPGIPRTHAEHLVKKYAHPKFELALSKYHEWRANVMKYAVDGGLFTPEQAAQIQKWENSVPLMRVFDDVPGLARRPAGSSSDPIKRLTGSGRRTRDWYATTIEQAARIKQATDRYRILQAVRNLRDTQGIGELLEGPLPKDMIPKDIQLNTKKILEDMGIDPKSVDADATIPYTFFEAAQRPKGQEPIITLRGPDGKAEWYRVSEGLWSSLEGLDLYRMGPVMDIVFGKSKRAFTLGVTGLRPAFGAVRNPMRDLPTYLLQTEGSTKTAAQNYAKAMKDVLAGKTGKDSPYYDLFERLSIDMAQPLGVDTNHLRSVVKNLGRGFKSKVVRAPIEHLRSLIQTTEAVPRVAELRQMAEASGYEIGTPMTVDQSIQLGLAGKRVTTDFTAAGDIARKVNSAVPFFNAQIQGTRTMARVAKRDRARFLLRGLSYLTAPTLALWWKNKDEEWYKDMPYREKFSYWHLTSDDSDTMLHIPRPFENGNLFATVPEAVIDSIYSENPDEFKAMWGYLWESSVPDLLPVPVQVAKEQLQNRVDYTQAPIETRGDERLPEAERAGPYTTKAAEFLGSVIGVSPKRIDHAARGLAGGLGRDVPTLLGLGASGRERDFEASDVPVVGTLFRRGGKGASQSQAVSDLYDRLRSVEKRGASKVHKETGPERQERLGLKDATKAISMLRSVQRDEKSLPKRQKIQKQIRDIAKSALAGTRRRGSPVSGRWR